MRRPLTGWCGVRAGTGRGAFSHIGDCGCDFALVAENPEETCATCATRLGSEDNAAAFAACEVLGFGIAMARHAGVTDDQLTAAFHTILTKPEAQGDYPIGGGHAFRSDELKWHRTFEPIGDEAVSR